MPGCCSLDDGHDDAYSLSYYDQIVMCEGKQAACVYDFWEGRKHNILDT